MIINKGKIIGVVNKKFDFWLTIIAITTFLTQFPNFYGEDIVNARENYLNGQKTDFWGGISTLVYAHIPSFGFRWQIWIAFFQIMCTYLGLISLIEICRSSSFKTVLNYSLTYCAFLFSSQMTRDGLMFSLLILGFGSLKKAIRNAISIRSLLCPIFIIVFGMSFRPWLSLAIVPLIILFFLNVNLRFRSKLTMLIIGILTISPMIFELSAAKALSLNKSFPEQQVIIMDAAASYCYTNNYQSGKKSLEILENFTKNENIGNFACQMFRPDTWLSLSNSSNFSARNFSTNLSLISVNDVKSYELIKSKWINLLLSDPITYFQNKILFAGKLVIGSDSRNFSLFSADNLQEKIAALYRLPFELFIAFHLFSIASVLIILFAILVFQMRNSYSVLIDKAYLFILISLITWLSLSSIAYIGSNGRYTYAVSLLSLLLIANPFKTNRSLQTE